MEKTRTIITAIEHTVSKIIIKRQTAIKKFGPTKRYRCIARSITWNMTLEVQKLEPGVSEDTYFFSLYPQSYTCKCASHN